MENILRFRRNIPIFLLGILFSVTLFFYFFEYSFTSTTILSFLPTLKDLGSLFISVLFISSLFILGIIGIALQNFFLIIIKLIFNLIIPEVILNKLILKFDFFKSLLSNGQIVKEYFLKNKEDILNYFYFKSCGNPENIAANKEIETLILNKIDKYYTRNFDGELITHFNYHGTVTQEQIKLDNLQSDINSFYYLILNVFTLTNLFIIVNSYGFWYDAILFVCFVCFVLLMLPQIHERKKFIASAIIYGFFDTFTVSELANIEDREAF